MLCEKSCCIVWIAPIIEEWYPLVKDHLRRRSDLVSFLNHLLDVPLNESVDTLEKLLASRAGTGTKSEESMMR